MSSVKLCSVKLNDGFFMPMLGFGTSAPNKVVTVASETEKWRTWVLIRTRIGEMQAGLILFVCKMLLSRLGYLVHEVSDFQIFISMKTLRFLLKMQIWRPYLQRLRMSRSGIGLKKPHF